MLKLILVLFMFIIPAKAAFLEGLEDFPIMKGLNEVKTESISFGNEEGRFVEASLKSESLNFNQVTKFYIDTLPQMGWKFQGKRENTLIFYREGEVLELEKLESSDLLIRITVKNKF